MNRLCLVSLEKHDFKLNIFVLKSCALFELGMDVFLIQTP